MKRILSALLALSAAAAVADGSPFSVSGSSGEFVVDTRSDIVITDVTSTYCSGEYGGQGGRAQTFISGVRCEISFTIRTSTRENKPVDHYLVNGRRQDEATFTFDVGSLSPGDRLTVIAVSQNNQMSRPFRVNVEIATAPPMWDTIYLSQIRADPDPIGHRVVYRAPEYRGFSLFDAMSDMAEIGSPEYPIEMPLELTPTLKLWQSADSSTGQYCEGADAGLSGGSYDKRGDTIGRFGGNNINVGLTGGGVYQYDPIRETWVLNSAELGVNYDFSWKVRQRLPDFPLVYVEIGFLSNGAFVMRQRNGDWSTDLNFEPLIAGKATAGIGADVLAQAEVSGQVGLHLVAHVPGGLERVLINGQVMWRVVLVGFEWTGTWWEGNFYFYPFVGPGSMYQESAVIGQNRRLATPDSVSGGFKPIARDYGTGATSISTKFRNLKKTGLRLAAASVDNPQMLMADGYPAPQPAIAAAGTDAAVAYVRDKASRADLDRTLLVVRDEASDGSWGAESAVWDDGTADFQPKLVFLPDGVAVAAWANAKRTFADGTSFGTVCSALEIAAGVRNPQSGAWDCANLTDDAALDWVPVLKGATNGTAAVAWVRNAAGAYIGSASQPSELAVSFYRNGAWSPMAVAVPAAGAILSHDIAWDGDKAVLVWAADADGDLMTDDSEIWARSFANGVWSAPVRLSAASASAMRPYAWFLGDGTPHAVWVQDDTLFASSGLAASSGAPAAAPEDVSVPSDFRLSVRDDGSATLLWATSPADSEGGLQGGVTSADYTPETGLSAPVTLFRGQSALMRNLSGAMGGDGTLRVAYESVAVSTNAEGALVYGAVDLAVHRREAVLDVGVAAEDCSFATNVVIGATNVLRVGIQNFGTSPVRSVAYRVWDGEGADKTLLASGETEVPPLSRVVVEAPWTPQEGLTNVAFTVEIDPDAVLADADRTNNTLLWRPDVGSPAISFRNAAAVRATDTLRLVSARLHNDSVSPLPAGTVVKFWRGEIGGALIGTDVAGLVGGAGDYDVGIAWDVSRATFTSAWERVVIELPAELGGRSVSVWTTTPLYEDDDPSGGGGGSGGTSEGGPSAPPDIGGTVGFATAGGESVFRFSFHGEAGFTYLVQYKNRLDEPAWITVLAVTPSETGDCPISVPVEDNEPSRFYRIVLE